MSDALMISSTLTELTLSGNQIGDAGATRISDALGVNTSLQKLYLEGNPINELGATQVSEALMMNSTLFHLSMNVPESLPPNVKEILRGKAYMNLIEKYYIPHIISNNPDLTNLRLYNYLNEDAIARLCAALMQNSTITSLDLSACLIGDHELAQFCEFLKMNVSVLSLNLEGTDISHIGAASLASALQINSTLTALDISYTSINDKGQMSLWNSLSWNQTLTYLNDQSYGKLNSQDKWIIRKNQSLYALLLHLVI